ncbi:MAG: ATP-binding cassette domain-containing protein, partial [Bacteroidaceae bacterium]|nr:ATP-binding cassette domain-containing protein [Bacteroidaceae bacterium]
MNLTIEKLTKSFGEKQALNIDHYAIHSGETIGLVGNNGAGKTTLFRIILDLLHADTGCVTIDGVVDGQPVSCDTSKSEAWKAYTGAFVDTGFLIDYLTPEEYFRFIAKISGISDAVLRDRLLQFDGFMNGEILGQKTLIRNLSMGNKQKVGIIG